MKILFYTPHAVAKLPPAAYAIGNFDGVHKGHRAVFDQTQALANAQQWPWGVITFEPHPRAVLSGFQRRLTPFPQKMAYLESLGVGHVCVIPFDVPFAQTSPDVFVSQILHQFCQAQAIVVGQDFHFGPERRANVMDLKALCKPLGIQVQEATLIADGEGRVIMSRRIVETLQKGEITEAAHMLGRPYGVSGLVIQGDQRGRQLGFPTANLLTRHFILPHRGVYAVTVILGKRTFQGVANIGIRPTFSLTEEIVEVHIFDFDETIYGETLEVRFGVFLRSEKKFENIPALIAQIHHDCKQAKALLALKEGAL